MSDVTATAYLVVKAERSPYGVPGQLTPIKPTGKITAARQSRPERLAKDEVLIKVTVRLPATAFDPITPAALIVVPEDLVIARHELEVEATEDE